MHGSRRVALRFGLGSSRAGPRGVRAPRATPGGRARPPPSAGPRYVPELPPSGRRGARKCDDEHALASPAAVYSGPNRTVPYPGMASRPWGGGNGGQTEETEDPNAKGRCDLMKGGGEGQLRLSMRGHLTGRASVTSQKVKKDRGERPGVRGSNLCLSNLGEELPG